MSPLAQEHWRLDETRCTSCGVCADVCPSGAAEMTRSMAYPAFHPVLCTACEACVHECPFDAITMVIEGRLALPTGAAATRAR